jgi:rod shape-determining protein MreC
MAIFANRSKEPAIYKIFKFLLFVISRSKILLLISCSIYMLYFADNTRLSNYLLDSTGLFSSTCSTAFEYIFKPINAIRDNALYLRDLKKENTELKFTLSRLQNMEQEIEVLRAENLALYNFISISSETKSDYITAKLLSVFSSPYNQIALISAGTLRGVRRNQIVTNGHSLIGKIIQVSDNYARVMLINDINSRIPIMTIKSRNNGILVGNNNNAKIIYLKKNHNIELGERVITSGDGEIYSPNIEIGKVTTINEYGVLVEPIVNLSEVQFVHILQNAMSLDQF